MSAEIAIGQLRRTPDGIVYQVRLNGQTNLAVFDRATSKLRVANVAPPMAPDFRGLSTSLLQRWSKWGSLYGFIP
jgi:hypothetical protein